MKKQSIVLSILLIWNWTFTYAGSSSLLRNDSPQKNKKSSSEKNKGFVKQIVPKFLYTYLDFNFDSTQGDNFNRFQGFSNLYAAGADHIKLAHNFFAGLYLFRIDTYVQSQVVLAPADLILSKQDIKNNTLFGHLLKAFNQHFYIDLAGAYGQNNISSQTLLTPTPHLGLSHSVNHNWFSSINGIYKYNWKKMTTKLSVGGLYNQVVSDKKYITYPDQDIPVQTVKPLTNKVVYILESLELGYKFTPAMTPFINGGLIQVASFKNSRETINIANILGAVPQLQMNKNAFRIGAGISFKLKQLTLRLEQKYYNAAGTFTSNDTLVSFSYQFS
ncbi:autotransporter outer membrane beta-barrel domain-containing protein [Legionella maioricensis]|uniref:Autotransporter outer membrane beta-barrel domain-containing protein n=1 Tax=Legionella maioricensis TaxID=2896528 RepID=A0A9X2CZG5_9GAMM|nr:autotransporter outer membrane beta-barrel domain-containing protein [Legionella maioricensis]MCL9683653.1 autotransporter outer membrane beta-barrel domain-containing protein [Legionella maioricensis]MCL9687675.1 autotransporter outer membrane beta-barrel domain-containing protein [Legionella maioricensis]